MLRRTFLFGAVPLLGRSLPRVLVIGDSISVGYTPFVREQLAPVAAVERIPGNGADSANVLKHIDEWMKSGPYRLVSLNCGLHDLKFTERHQVPIAEYRRNLPAILDCVEKRGSRVLWVTTTPIEDERHAARKAGFSRLNRDVDLYNEAATEIMRTRGVPVCDLNALVRSRGIAEMLGRDGTHYSREGYRILSAAVADAISRQILQLK